jgi:NAD(P)-dependent dehydrogenase (short-subunit alcohol dehydrogenase family)
MRLQGKVAVITGAGSGIGRAIALRFAREGANVAINDINAAAGESLAAQIAAEGGAAFFLRGDAASEEDVSALMRAVRDRFGALHILINNAVPNMEAVNSNRWDTLLQVGFKGYWLCMQAAIPLMQQAGSGSIVNISSVNALMGLGRDHVYSGVKAAIIGMSRSMVGEFSPQGLRINCICPGTVIGSRFLNATRTLQDAFRASIPSAALDVRMTLPTRRCFSPPTRRRSSPEAFWSWTEA